MFRRTTEPDASSEDYKNRHNRYDLTNSGRLMCPDQLVL